MAHVVRGLCYKQVPPATGRSTTVAGEKENGKTKRARKVAGEPAGSTEEEVRIQGCFGRQRGIHLDSGVGQIIFQAFLYMEVTGNSRNTHKLFSKSNTRKAIGLSLLLSPTLMMFLAKGYNNTAPGDKVNGRHSDLAPPWLHCAAHTACRAWHARDPLSAGSQPGQASHVVVCARQSNGSDRKSGKK